MEQIALGDLEKDAELSELDVAMFSRAPVEAMQATLAYLRRVPLPAPSSLLSCPACISVSHGHCRRLHVAAMIGRPVTALDGVAVDCLCNSVPSLRRCWLCHAMEAPYRVWLTGCRAYFAPFGPIPPPQ